MATKFWASSIAGSFTTAGNWSDAAAPASGDTLYFSHLATGDVTSGLATGIGSGAGAESLTLHVEHGYTGSIGTVGSGAATYLSFSSALETLDVFIGAKNSQGTTEGSPGIFIDTTNVATANIYVYDSAAASTELYYPPVLIKPGATTLNLYMTGGSVGVAARPGESGTLAKVQLSLPDGTAAPTVTPNLLLGPGVTVTTLEANCGTILSRSTNTATTVNLSGTAYYQHLGTGAHTTLSCDGSAVVMSRGSGNIGTLNLSGTFKRRGELAMTITTLNIYEGATLDINNGVMSGATTTITTKNLVRCGLDDITVATPKGINW